MSELLIWLCLGVVGMWFFLVIAAISLYDIRTIRREKMMRRHPHARRWRSRPFIAAQYYGKPSDESLRSLHAGSYRHMAIDYQLHDLTLHLPGSTVLPKTALHDANSQLLYRPSLRFIEIIPLQRFPETTRQFFAAYHSFAIMPFIKLRSVLNIRPLTREWPIIIRQPSDRKGRDYAYTAASWILALCNIMLLSYTAYIAVFASQLLYLALYAGMFGLWLSWSIMNHPWLSATQKIGYLLLAPASLGFFVWRVLVAPLRPLRLVRRRAYPQRVLS